ncbi:MAG: cysteine desulfurase family protein [Treponema sp.]
MTDEQKKRYFDWAAAAPVDEDIVSAAMKETLSLWGNPSSGHSAGREAAAALQKARERAAKALGVKAQTLYFTSGGTESDQIPLLSVLNRPQRGSVLISSIEHPAVREQAWALKKCGWTVNTIPANKDGIITPSAVIESLADDTVLVCVMAVNNETGAIQPVKEIAGAIAAHCKGKRRPKLHVDCVQAAGKIPVELNIEGLDSAAFSAHKLGGLRGTGLLYAASPLEPFLRGGGQENGVRSGTENLLGAAALSLCLERYCIPTSGESEARTRYELQKKYAAAFTAALAALPSCTIIPERRITAPDSYSPWIVQAAFKNIPGQVMVRALDAEGFYISTGSACSSRKNNRPVLDAMRLPRGLSENAVRFSFGPATTEDALRALTDKVREICGRFSRG